MLQQILKVIPSYLTKTQALKEAAYQKKNAPQKEDYVSKVEIVDAYKFYKLSKGYSQTIKKLGYPPLNTFIIHIIYTKIEDIATVEAHKNEMIRKSTPKKAPISKSQPQFFVLTPDFNSIEFFSLKPVSQLIGMYHLALTLRA